MRVADRWPELAAKYATAAHLPMREALALLADPRKPHLAVVTEEIADRVADGEPAEDAVRDVVLATRFKYAGSRNREDRANRYVEITVQQVRSALGDVDDYNEALTAAVLDVELVPVWVADLEGTAKRITAFARRLTEEARRRRSDLKAGGRG